MSLLKRKQVEYCVDGYNSFKSDYEQSSTMSWLDLAITMQH